MHVAGVEGSIAYAGRHAGSGWVVEGRGPVGGIRPVVPVRHGEGSWRNRVCNLSLVVQGGAMLRGGSKVAADR